MSMANLVESARRATAPIVGIPLEGEKPFAIRRDLLVNSLKGLKIIDAGVQLDLQTGKPSELVVYASGENVKAVRKFKPLDVRYIHPYKYTVRMYLGDWAEKQREKRKQPKIRTSARQKQIAKLQKQLAKMEPRAPLHPFLPSKYGRQEYPQAIAQQWAAWKREAHIRRWIQIQARQCIGGKLTTHALYRTLSERGITVKKWSELRTHNKERCDNSLYGYLGKLWEFCGLASKPSYWFEPEREQELGPSLYKGWLEDVREYNETKSQIENLMILETEGGVQ